MEIEHHEQLYEKSIDSNQIEIPQTLDSYGSISLSLVEILVPSRLARMGKK